jgi:2-keto-4-pentenoate hydratase/2-oxohepta-3-ene-1,7-dioic acid hydratase in catechol pathway
MKLLRYGAKGKEKPGAVDVNSRIRDLSNIVQDITAETSSPASIAQLCAMDLEKLPIVNTPVRIGIPYRGIGKVICIGLNYRDHAAETGQAIPDEPILFLKATSSLNGPNDPIILPKDSRKSDWEVELGVMIGSRASYVSKKDALGCVAGYFVVNDLSEREFQLERGGQWDKGKGCDTFGPVGLWLVTSDEIADPQCLDLWLEVNGIRCQTGNTRTMIFDVPNLISYISQFMTLNPGDLICTGTPPGVGLGRTPPTYLKPGDTMRLGISGLGEQVQEVFAWGPTFAGSICQ